MITIPSSKLCRAKGCLRFFSTKVTLVRELNKNVYLAQRGFTLIELVITVVILAILAAIAIPSYRTQIRQSAEEQAKARALAVADQLANWRSKRLSYAGFKPINQGCTGGETACFSEGLPTGIYIPLGSNATSYKYKLTIDATARRWRILAEPNPSDGIVNEAQRYYLDSLGQRCIYAVGTALPSLTATNINCASGGAGISQW